MKVTDWGLSILADPRTHRALAPCDRSSLPPLHPIGRSGFDAPQFGATDTVLKSDTGDIAFPVADGFPVLMWPEVLFAGDHSETVDLHDWRYEEAYAEMEHYNPIAYGDVARLDSFGGFLAVKRIKDTGLSAEHFPEPLRGWVQPCFDVEAKIDCDRYVAPIKDKTVLQLGGQGRDAARLLLAGASEAILVTPMIGEAALAVAVAERLGVADRFSCVLGLGEEIPVLDKSVDVLTSQGCLHHMRLELAFAEIHRVLKPGGRFVAVDPWRAPLYAIGTKLLGKRGQGVVNRSQSIHCSPITAERLSDLERYFTRHAVNNHGPMLRYPLIALDKFNVRFPPPILFWLNRLDDKIGRFMHLPKTWGGSLMIGGERGY